MVLVFKTSVENEAEINKVAPILDRLLEGEGSWNFDLEDCDRILRVVTEERRVEDITLAVEGSGYFCEELGD
ncbi:hypothetical protein GCM10028791_28700 [Echinicola sediminis]